MAVTNTHSFRIRDVAERLGENASEGFSAGSFSQQTVCEQLSENIILRKPGTYWMAFYDKLHVELPGQEARWLESQARCVPISDDGRGIFTMTVPHAKN